MSSQSPPKPPLSDTAHAIILDSISDGVFTVDHNWRIMTFNRAAEEITGTPREEAIGRYCWEVFRSNMCEGDCALKRTMQEGKSFVSTSTYIINTQHQRIPIGVSTAPLKNEQGEILGGVETFRDHSLVEKLRQELSGTPVVGDLVSRSTSMKCILTILPQVAESDSTVLLEGETGTGKEFMASALHSLSLRKGKPFIAINCGALPDSLLESELFGYKAGAFTSAVKDKPGLFASADGGTIFLDEIGDTSAAFQVKLLRFLQEKEFQPLGSVEKYHSDTRIIVATNQDLDHMVDQGTFRQDLFYRINIIRFPLPSLRDRKEDIPLLVERFIEKMNHLRGRTVQGLSPEAMAVLLDHDYPGNIRELENIIEHGFILCHSGDLQVEHLPAYLLNGAKRQDVNLERSRHSSEHTASEPAMQPDHQAQETGSSMQDSVQHSEAQAILRALENNMFNRAATARELGIHKSTLFRKIKKYQLSLPPKDGRSTKIKLSPSS